MSLPYRTIPVQEMPTKALKFGPMGPLKIPNKVPHGGYVWAAYLIMTYISFRIGRREHLSRKMKEKETFDSRITIYPYLLAEQDIQFIDVRKKILEEEAEVMKDVPNWVVGQSVYNNNRRWMPPTTKFY